MGYEDLRAVVGPRRTLDILEVLAVESPRNYSAIEGEVPTSSDTITRGLDVLQQYDLITRTEQSKKDVQYAITNDGRTVLERCRELDEFLSNGE